MGLLATLGLVNAGINVASNIGNWISASQTNKGDREFAREMSDLEWQRNLEAWNMQNEYNTPANQYARQLEGLRVNGLNPNLVYGSSSNVTGAASAPAPYKFENYHSTMVPQLRGMSLYDDFLNTRLLQTQVQAQEAANRLTNARAKNEEDRNPGIVAKSSEAKTRWDYITRDLQEEYDAAIRAQISLEYWKGVKGEYDASAARDKSNILFYEAAIAEWLNTTEVPGTGLTYRQYLEQYRAFMSKEQYEYVKEATINLASMVEYRKNQGEYLDLRKEYQQYVNRFAKMGRGLGNDWFNVLFSGLSDLLGEGGDENIFKSLLLGPGASIYEWLKNRGN